MPFNETAVYMEKHNKHDESSGSNRESNVCSPTVQMIGKSIDNPLMKYQGCKWGKVLNFDRVLKQIRNADRYYLRGKHNNNPQAGSSRNNSGCVFKRRVQPQVQRLKSTDMHFYGIVPKKPFDVVVCNVCLGIYTKMGFNNHMKLHHTQTWKSISKASTSTAGSVSLQEPDSSTTLLTEKADTTAMRPPSSTSRHKSSKSSGGGGGSSGGSSRSRSKSKHHHHHHLQQRQQVQQRSYSASSAAASTRPSQTSTTNTGVSKSSTSAKISKKTASGLRIIKTKLNLPPPVPIETQQMGIQPVSLFLSSTSNSSNLPPTSKPISSDLTVIQPDIVYPSTTQAVKEKPKASKRKAKYISVPLSLPPPESNDSSNSSLEYTAAIAAATVEATAASATTVAKSSSKRSKPKGGKDLKQLMEPQLSELDKAISSITENQTEVLNEGSNGNDNDCDGNMLNTPISNCTNAIGYSTEEASLQMQTQVPIASTRQQQQQSHYGAMPMLPESNGNNAHQPQLQQQRSSNSEENDNSILTLEDMLDSKFIHEILNTDESEIHFDESELDKVAQQQQQQQQAYIPPTTSKRMRYDDQITSGHVENVAQQPTLSGKYAAFQQQQQQQTQQAFHVANLEDIKMYTTAIDAQQFLAAPQHQPQQQSQQQQQEQHQITTIDPIQLQQLLYQQQQQQHQEGLNAYSVGTSLDEVSSALEQQHYNDSDVIMCSAEQLHKEGKINAADYATLAALSGNNSTYGNVTNNVCDVNAIAAAAQFQVYNIPSLTDDDVTEDTSTVGNKMNDVIIPQNHYVLPAEGNDEDQLIYEITANNQVSVISQQRQQQMIAEFFTQAGYDSVDNVNANLNSGVNVADGSNETKYSTQSTPEVDISTELLDFDFSLLDAVKSCSSTSSSSDSKTGVKVERNSKFISPTNITDDLFLNVFLYAGLPRPMAVNNFGLCKLPQGVATTFRKNLHATRKANNSPISLNGNTGGAAATTRFSSNVPNAKPTASQNYFTALGGGSNAGNAVNEFSIGSITITNQTHQSPNNTSLIQQQQQIAQKQGLLGQTSVEMAYGASNANGLITTAASAPSPPSSNMHATANSRSSRPKSAGSASSGSSQSKLKFGSNSSSSSNAATIPLPQSQAKTIIVNANNVSTANADQAKFIKRSLISKTNAIRKFNNFTTKQLSEILLHPSKEKYMQLLAPRDQDKDAITTGISLDQQRLSNVKQFYERRKRLLNPTATSTMTSSGYNQARQLNSQQPPTTAAGLKQKFLRQRLLRTLSDCGINSIKTNNNSANNSSNNDILRVS